MPSKMSLCLFSKFILFMFVINELHMYSCNAFPSVEKLSPELSRQKREVYITTNGQTYKIDDDVYDGLGISVISRGPNSSIIVRNGKELTPEEQKELKDEMDKVMENTRKMTEDISSRIKDQMEDLRENLQKTFTGWPFE